MKVGVVLSSAAHVAILTWGLLNFAAPAPLQVADVEALPIDIVPIEELTQSVAGEKKAELTEKPAPAPTKRPDVIKDAQNVGEAKDDQKSQPDVKPAEQPVEVAKAETPPPAPEPTPSPKVEPDAQPVKEDVPAPTTEVASLNEPAVPVTPETISPEPAVADSSEQFASLEKVQVVPTKRPDAPKPKVAETTERKKVDETAKTATATADNQEKSVTDEIASLLNKQEPQSTGAKQSTQTASLGTSKPSNSGKLSTSEMDALKGQLARCWSIPAGAAGADELKVSVEFDLDANARLTGRPRVISPSGNSTFDSSAVRAIQKCDSEGFNLPTGKYDVWNEVVVNFDPSDMF
jgi:colicin import membrane protein